MDKLGLFVFVAVLMGEAATAQSPARTQGLAPNPSSGLGREFPMTFVRNQCPESTRTDRGGGFSDLRECRVSEFGEFGSVDEQTYYYALYCLIPNHAPDEGKCDDGSFNSRYNRWRALAVFVRDA